ncbi:MAG: IS630 family transposase [Candidatus Rokuibacteriota bacterium]
MAYKAQPIVLDEETRRVLEARVRAMTTPQRDVTRARIILLAADGIASRQISQQVGMHGSHIAMWRQRFLAEGLKGLADAPRPGHPVTYDADDRLKMVALATAQRDPGDPEATWTYQALADALAHDVGISRSQLWRILDDLDIKPHKVVGWLNRREDPEFWDRVREVCGLYLAPPQNALVLSVDEKTGIQAKERCAPTSPAAPGRACRQEFEYVRHGTASLLAALEVHSGRVLAKDIERNDSVTFIGFLEELDRTVDPELAIHLILDNGSSHTSKATRAWIEEHTRFAAHYTPVHASWVNQVELVFSILTRKVLKRGSFGSRDELVSKIMRYIALRNETAKPFAWTYSAQPLKVAL